MALFEFAKGLIVLVAGLGLLSLIGGDVQAFAEDIVRRLHLNPAHHFPRIFIQFASHLTDTQLWFYAWAALVYAAVRFVETYGLWHERSWAEWFAVISACLYLPIELFNLVQERSLLSLFIPIINLGIIIYLAMLLAANYRRRAQLNRDPEDQ